ncbi:MAG: ribonuclease III [Coriobacteriales bacterium]
MRTVLWKVNRIQDIIGYHFTDVSLIRAAITHPSAVEGQPVSASYERLEFLGDSVVGMVVADELFRQFPEIDEGGLTRLKVSLISGESLSAAAGERGFEDVLILGPSERGAAARGMHSALENVYESVVGAMYLDGGLEVARRWIIETLKPHLAPWRCQEPENPKSLLQEKTQADIHETPHYEMVSEDGPAHAPTFVCNCLVGERVVGTGRGSSKKEAEAAAAAAALKAMGYVSADDRSLAFDPDKPWPSQPIEPVSPIEMADGPDAGTRSSQGQAETTGQD